MNKRFWNNTKIFKQFERGTQEDLLNSFIGFDCREKKKRTERKRTIPFYQTKGDIALGYWDEQFFDGHITFETFQQICNEIQNLKKEIEANKVVLQSLNGSKKVVKIAFLFIFLSFIFFYVALQEWFTFSKHLYIVGLVLAAVGIMIAFVTSLWALKDVPRLERCINPTFNKLSEYVKTLNERLKDDRLAVNFDVQLMQLEISKL